MTMGSQIQLEMGYRWKERGIKRKHKRLSPHVRSFEKISGATRGKFCNPEIKTRLTNITQSQDGTKRQEKAAKWINKTRKDTKEIQCRHHFENTQCSVRMCVCLSVWPASFSNECIIWHRQAGYSVTLSMIVKPWRLIYTSLPRCSSSSAPL